MSNATTGTQPNQPDHIRDEAARPLHDGYWPIPLVPAGIPKPGGRKGPDGKPELETGKRPFGPEWGEERNTPETLATKYKDLARADIRATPQGSDWH